MNKKHFLVHGLMTRHHYSVSSAGPVCALIDSKDYFSALRLGAVLPFFLAKGTLGDGSSNVVLFLQLRMVCWAVVVTQHSEGEAETGGSFSSRPVCPTE